MAQPSIQESQQSLIAAVAAQMRAGQWAVEPGEAVTLRARVPGRITVVAGRLWATSDGPHTGPGGADGDRLVAAGETLAIQAGERWVVEPACQAAVHFEWVALSAPAPVVAAAAPWQALMVLLGAGFRAVGGAAAVGPQQPGRVTMACRSRNAPGRATTGCAGAC